MKTKKNKLIGRDGYKIAPICVPIVETYIIGLGLLIVFYAIYIVVYLYPTRYNV